MLAHDFKQACWPALMPFAAASKSIAKASLPVRICQRIFQASKNSSHHASGDFVRGLDVGQTFERPRKATPKWLLPRHFRRKAARRCTRRLEPASFCRSATSNIGQRWRLGNRRKCCGSALRARWPVYAAANAGAARSGSTQHDAACWDRHILHTRLFTVSRPAGGQKRCAISTLPPRQPAKRRARCGSLHCAARWTTLTHHL